MITNEQHREIEARLERNRKPRAQTAAYDCGFDAGKNGANEENAHHSLFSTEEKAAEWQRGYKDAKREMDRKPKAFREPKGDPGFARLPEKSWQTVGVEDEIRDLIQQKKELGTVNVVLDFWSSEGVPAPYTEFRFHPHRKWRFDFAWPGKRLYLECQGGIWTQGRHVRGEALLKEWEKIGEASILGWRPLFCQPSDLLTVKQTLTIKRALFYELVK